LTTTELRNELPDVPPASLYRHIALLVEHGVLAVAAERRVRGAVERTHILRAAASSIGDDELSRMSKEEHEGAFRAYLAGLFADFERYLAAADVDYARDRVGYRIAAMWLSDDEFDEMVGELVALLQPRLANGQRRGRKRRVLGTVFLPG
ncbi:MAG: helix-turn-helix domain-containing protein, partial [Solirubrobacteraceae bacterium]